MLKLNNISKTYGQTIALKTIDLFIPEGKTTVLLGQSGSGKSTLICIINGLIQPDEGGTVLFEDTQVTPQNALTLRHKMGYVIQKGVTFI